MVTLLKDELQKRWSVDGGDGLPSSSKLGLGEPSVLRKRKGSVCDMISDFCVCGVSHVC